MNPEQLLPAQALERLRAAPVRWWVCGGLALQLHTGRVWRMPADIDIAVHPSVHELAGRLSGVDLTVSAGDADCWVYRCEPALRVPWAEAVLTTASGVPYLSPELVLLSKARRLHPRDEHDAAHLLPLLTMAQRARLMEQIPADHPWRPSPANKERS